MVDGEQPSKKQKTEHAANANANANADAGTDPNPDAMADAPAPEAPAGCKVTPETVAEAEVPAPAAAEAEAVKSFIESHFTSRVDYEAWVASLAGGGGGGEAPDVGAQPKERLGVHVVGEKKLANGALLVISQGSVVGFAGDAIVNAANEGCLGGGGVDGAIGRAGGDDLYDAREALPVVEDPDVNQNAGWRSEVRCPTGQAVITSGRFGALKCDHVIHAVGPAYPGFQKAGDAAAATVAALDAKLKGAYINTIKRAQEAGVRTLGFCLISAGIFSGCRGLKGVLSIGMDAIKEAAYPGLEVHMVAFLEREVDMLVELGSARPEGAAAHAADEGKDDKASSSGCTVQ